MNSLTLAIALTCVSVGAHAQTSSSLAPPLQPQTPPVVTRPQDPTQLTTEALRREIELLGSLFGVELESIKRSQETFEESITRFPTDVDKQVGQLGSLFDEKFATVEQRFANIESLLAALKESIATADLNRAENIGIALTAQQASVNKAAEGTAEQIRNINDVQRAREEILSTSIAGVGISQNDLKDRITALENRLAGAVEQRSTSQEGADRWIGWVFGAIGLAVAGVAMLRASGHGSPPVPPQPQVVYVQAPPPAPTMAKA